MRQLSHEQPTHNCTTISQSRCRPTKPTSVMNVPQKLAHAEEFVPGPTYWFEECRVDRTKNYFDQGLPNVQRDRSAQTSAFERNKRMHAKSIDHWVFLKPVLFLTSKCCVSVYGRACGLVVNNSKLNHLGESWADSFKQAQNAIQFESSWEVGARIRNAWNLKPPRPSSPNRTKKKSS